MGIISKLLNFFKSDNEIDADNLKKIVYDYTFFKDDYSTVSVIDKDIKISIDTIKKINEFDFLADDIIEVQDIKESSYKTVRFFYWLTNDMEKFEDLDTVIKDYINCSSLLITKFNALRFIAENNKYRKYNIRRLQPYIINIVEIRKSLLSVYKEFS